MQTPAAPSTPPRPPEAADDGRTFANLFDARAALWREVCALDDDVRSLEGLRRLGALHDRLGEAALVVRGSDPTRPSGEAARYRPGQHVSTC